MLIVCKHRKDIQIKRTRGKNLESVFQNLLGVTLVPGSLDSRLAEEATNRDVKSVLLSWQQEGRQRGVRAAEAKTQWAQLCWCHNNVGGLTPVSCKCTGNFVLQIPVCSQISIPSHGLENKDPNVSVIIRSGNPFTIFLGVVFCSNLKSPPIPLALAELSRSCGGSFYPAYIPDALCDFCPLC